MNLRTQARCMFRLLPMLAIALAWSVTTPCLLAQEPTTATHPADAAGSTAAAPRVVDYNNPTLEDILTAWREREEKVKNYELVWDERTENWSVTTTGEDGTLNPLPIVSNSTENRIIATNDSMLFRYHAPSRTTTDLTGSPILSRANPSGRGTFYDMSANPKERNAGSMDRADISHYVSMITMAPLLMLYRPLWHPCQETRSMRKQEDGGATLTLLSDRDSNGRPIVEITRSPRRYECAVRQAPGFPIECILSFIDFNGKRDIVPMIVELELVEHPDAGWVPSSWTTQVVLDNGKLSTSHAARLTSSRFNANLPPRTFDPTYFPAGTIVHDLRETQDSSGRYSAVYESDGESLIPYDEHAAITAASAAADAEKARKRIAWGFAEYSISLNVILFIVLFGAWLWRRRTNN